MKSTRVYVLSTLVVILGLLTAWAKVEIRELNAWGPQRSSQHLNSANVPSAPPNTNNDSLLGITWERLRQLTSSDGSGSSQQPGNGSEASGNYQNGSQQSRSTSDRSVANKTHTRSQGAVADANYNHEAKQHSVARATNNNPAVRNPIMKSDLGHSRFSTNNQQSASWQHLTKAGNSALIAQSAAHNQPSAAWQHQVKPSNMAPVRSNVHANPVAVHPTKGTHG